MEEKDLLEIINKLQKTGQEWNTVDAKRELILKENGDKAEFVKDVVAMANNGEPSYLIIGLEDGTFSSVGNLSHHHSKEKLNQILEKNTDPPIIVDYKEFTIGGNEYALVEINGQNPPYMVARDLAHKRTDRKKVTVYKGTIYIRHADITAKVTRVELDEILKRKGLQKEFENETERAQKLALERPDDWEYLLTAELLRDKMVQVRQRLSDLERGLIYRKAVQLSGAEFGKWSSPRWQNLISLANILNIALEKEIPASWGKPGEAGDPLEIKQAVSRVSSVCDELLELEIDLHSVIPPTSLMRLKHLMAGWATHLLNEIEKLPSKLTEAIERPDSEEIHTVEVVFETPPHLYDELMAELERLKNNPEEWMNEY